MTHFLENIIVETNRALQRKKNREVERERPRKRQSSPANSCKSST